MGWLLLPLHLERSSSESRPNVCGLGSSHTISHILAVSLTLVSHSDLENEFLISVSISYSQLVMTLPWQWLYIKLLPNVHIYSGPFELLSSKYPILFFMSRLWLFLAG